MTYDGINIGEAVQPIQDRVETYQSNGYAVISPGDALSAGAYAVTVNSGNLDASDTLSVGSSNDEIIFDGSTKSLPSATNIRINSVSAAGDGTEQYRYDVIYADSSGEVQKTEGSVTKLDSRESQNNLTRFERFKAAIPNPGSDPSVIIAAVIVNSSDSSVGTSQLRDYRMSATHKVSALEATKITNTGLTESQTSLSSQTPIVEDWERGVLSYYTEDTGQVEITQAQVLQGSNSLRNSGFNDFALISSPFEGKRGFNYRIPVYFEPHNTQTAQSAAFILVTDRNTRFTNGDGYQIVADKGNSELTMRRFDNGSSTSLASVSATIPTDEWLLMDITLDYELIEFSLNQLDQTNINTATANDTTHTDLFIQYLIRSEESNKYSYLDQVTRGQI